MSKWLLGAHIPHMWHSLHLYFHFAFQENTPEEERTVPMKQDTYVRVYGHLRSFNNKRNVVAFKILPVTDMNELTTHLLETIHSHMYLDKSRMAVSDHRPRFTSLACKPSIITVWGDWI